MFGLLVLMIGASAADVYGLPRLRHSEREVDGLLLSQPRGDIVGLLRLESLRFHSDGVGARLELREIEAACIVCPRTAL